MQPEVTTQPGVTSQNQMLPEELPEQAAVAMPATMIRVEVAK